MTLEFIKQNQFFFIAILALVTFCLAIYLGVLMKRLRVQNNEQKRLVDEYKKELADKASYYKDSILIISKATIQGQCETSEACVRIKKLLEMFPEISQEKDFLIIEKMFAELADFAILDKRKELSTQEKFNQDKLRFEVEEKYNDDFMISLKSLINRFELLN